MSGFDGLIGKMSVPVMERRNREAEEEAIEILGPHRTDSIVVLGFGPGIGVSMLVERLDGGVICGVDPSKVMVERAKKHVGKDLKGCEVDLRIGTSESIPFDPIVFDGAIAVNTMQFFEPLGPSLAEIRRVMKTGGKFVSVTHGWAIEKHSASVEEWVGMVKETAIASGFCDMRWRRGRSEKGTAVVIELDGGEINFI